MALPLVEAKCNLKQFDPARVELGVSAIDQIKERIADLTLEELDPVRGINAMAFTDGEPDGNVSLFFLDFLSAANLEKDQFGIYNHTCCFDIISFALFKKTSSPGRKYPTKFGPPFSIEMLAFGYTIVSLVYLCCFHGTKPENVQIRCCLDEWKEGIQKHAFLDSRTYDRVYDTILADI